MAAPILRRATISFISGNNSSLLRKFYFSFSFSLYFSTQTTKPPLEPHTVTKFLIDNHHFSPNAAAHIASLARLKSHENADNADSILSFLKRTGFSDTQLEKNIKTLPRLLSASLDATIKPKFEVLRDLGFTSVEIVELLVRQPRVLYHSAPRIFSSISVLKSVLGSTAAAAKFLMAAGGFQCDMDAIFLPNVEFLKSCGVSMEQIVAFTSCAPIFLHKPENLRKLVEKVDAMGLDQRSRNFIHGVREVGSMTNQSWDAKVKTLRDLGFSEEDVMRAFKNSPKVFSSSSEKMKSVGI